MADVTTEMIVKLQGQIDSLAKTMDEAEAITKQTSEKMEDYFEKSSKNSEKSIDNISVSLEKVGKTAESAGKVLTVALTAPIVAGGAAIAKLALDVVESENLFEVSFKNMATQAREWSKDTSDALGLNEFELRKNSAQLFTMASSMGVATQEAYKVSTGITKLSSDMASFYNTTDEDAFGALRSGLTGEAEPLKRFGIIVNETTIKMAALRHGLIEEGEQLSESGKVMARYLAIMDATNDAQGDLARTLDSPTNQLRILKTQFIENATALGVELLPVISEGVELLGDLGDVVGEAVESFQNMPDETQKTIVAVSGLTAALGPTLIAGGKLIQFGVKAAPVLKGVSVAIAALNPVTLALGAGLGAIAVGYAVANTELVDYNKLQLQAIQTTKAKTEEFITLSAQYETLADKQNKSKEEEKELEEIGRKLLALNPSLASSTDDLASSYKDELAPAVLEANKALVQLERTSIALRKIELNKKIVDQAGELSSKASEAASALAAITGENKIALQTVIAEGSNAATVYDEFNKALQQIETQLANVQVVGSRGLTDRKKLVEEQEQYENALKVLGEYIAAQDALQASQSEISSLDLGDTSVTQTVAKVEETTKVTKDKATKKQKAEETIVTNYTEEEQQYLDHLQNMSKYQQDSNLKTFLLQKELGEKLAAEYIESDKVAQDVAFEYQRLIIQQKAELGSISKQEEIAQLAEIENQKLQIQKEALEQRKLLYDEETLQYQIFSEKIRAIATQQAANIQIANAQTTQATTQDWLNASDIITGTISSNLSNIIGEQRTFAEISADIAKEMANKSISYLIDKALTAISISAAEGAAGTFASAASNPLTLFLAPALAAGTFAAISAYSGSIDSAAGGYYDVPNDMLANIHKNEMVLPAAEAKIIRENISTTGTVTGSTAPLTTGVDDTGINAVSVNLDKEIMSSLNQNGSALVKIMKNEVRSGRV